MWNWFYSPLTLSIAALGGLTMGACDVQTDQQALLSDNPLRSAVESYLRSLSLKESRPAWFAFSFVGLTGHGRQAVVYLTGTDWCGTGGCTLLVLAPWGSSYKVLSRIPAVRPPIRVLESKSNGWHDLSVWTSGGGIQRGYEGIVRFDGKNYSRVADSPGGQHAAEMKGKTILSSKDKEVPLYP